MRTHPLSLPFRSQILKRYWITTHQAFCSSLGNRTFKPPILTGSYCKINCRWRHSSVHIWLNPCLLSFFRGEGKRTYQRYLCATSWVRALHCTCPDPSDDCRLATTLLLWKLYLWVEMPDALPRFVTHPIAIIADILCQPFGLLPLFMEVFFARFWVDRRASGKLRWNFNHRLVDEHSHRIEVARIRL